eukprot:TRINITY_DN23100_c0_g1_i1.p1 TRINITY_DN23100_c0_g1~~TRINITY_DN23100_c0_g1_i1.p1  ORF type:complete len:502 (-),score=183.94 TRINITY_DN23100_c0_g1_i1:417-1922(-)
MEGDGIQDLGRAKIEEDLRHLVVQRRTLVKEVAGLTLERNRLEERIVKLNSEVVESGRPSSPASPTRKSNARLETLVEALIEKIDRQTESKQELERTLTEIRQEVGVLREQQQHASSPAMHSKFRKLKVGVDMGVHAGWLHRRLASDREWTRSFCVLHRSSTLKLHRNKEDLFGSHGELQLIGSTLFSAVRQDGQVKPLQFSIRTDQGDVVFRADSRDSKEAWVDSIRAFSTPGSSPVRSTLLGSDQENTLDVETPVNGSPSLEHSKKSRLQRIFSWTRSGSGKESGSGSPQLGRASPDPSPTSGAKGPKKRPGKLKHSTDGALLAARGDPTLERHPFAEGMPLRGGALADDPDDAELPPQPLSTDFASGKSKRPSKKDKKSKKAAPASELGSSSEFEVSVRKPKEGHQSPERHVRFHLTDSQEQCSLDRELRASEKRPESEDESSARMFDDFMNRDILGEEEDDDDDDDEDGELPPGPQDDPADDIVDEDPDEEVFQRRI